MMDIAVFGKLSSLGNDEVRYALCLMNVYSRDLGDVVLKDRTAQPRRWPGRYGACLPASKTK